jgi:hypothetical protein
MWQSRILNREMIRGVPERDWKYLSSVKGDMLEALCGWINDEACSIAADQASSQHERFLRLYSYLMQGDTLVSDCFDDWRRSNILDKLFVLRRHRLLTDEHLSRLSAEVQEMLRR